MVDDFPVTADLIRGGEGSTTGGEREIATIHTASKTEMRGRRTATIAGTPSKIAFTSNLRAELWADEPTVEEHAEEVAVEEHVEEAVVEESADDK
ncbi:hypothetical protein CRG98_036226 [Punica granatum]|uniref:Uncharacterized protein n=1 Tax=Punica granatum TaxID=22663 RepID=A0A2I0IHI7_PUNGR|nr:hypothetical protein CRG98_036226 [Punica granatum]